MKPEKIYTRNLQADPELPTEEAALVAVMQRPGKRAWAIYDASLLADPTGQRRDPDIYLGERAAQGDARILEIDNVLVWLPNKEGEWRPVTITADKSERIVARHVQWSMDGQGRWIFEVKA